jgi:hypothetical protein
MTIQTAPQLPCRDWDHPDARGPPQLFPEWPLAATSRARHDVSAAVSAALLEINASHPAVSTLSILSMFVSACPNPSPRPMAPMVANPAWRGWRVLNTGSCGCWQGPPLPGGACYRMSHCANAPPSLVLPPAGRICEVCRVGAAAVVLICHAYECGSGRLQHPKP